VFLVVSVGSVVIMRVHVVIIEYVVVIIGLLVVKIALHVVIVKKWKKNPAIFTPPFTEKAE
jgi:hypothetical protein